MIKYLRDFLSTPLKEHLYLLLGLNFSLSYFYFLFVLEKPIREIPFTLTFWRCSSIIMIISLQIYMFYRYFKPSSSRLLTIFVQNYFFWVLESLSLLDRSVKALPFIEKRYNAFILNLIRNTNSKKMLLLKKLVLLINILPRILLCCVFFIDVFYFKELHYLYNAIWLSILPFFSYYFIFCIKSFNAIHIHFLEKNVMSISTTYRYGVLPPEEDYWSDVYIEDEEENEEPPHGMKLKVRTFLDYRWWCIKNNDEHQNDDFNCDIKTEYHEEYIKITNRQFTHRDTQELRKYYESIEIYIYDLMKSHQMLEAIRTSLTDLSKNNYLKRISLLILWLYFLAWISILFLSVPSLSLEEIVVALQNISRILEEPFSGVNLKDLMVFKDYITENDIL